MALKNWASYLRKEKRLKRAHVLQRQKARTAVRAAVTARKEFELAKTQRDESTVEARAQTLRALRDRVRSANYHRLGQLTSLDATRSELELYRARKKRGWRGKLRDFRKSVFGN